MRIAARPSTIGTHMARLPSAAASAFGRRCSRDSGRSCRRGCRSPPRTERRGLHRGRGRGFASGSGLGSRSGPPGAGGDPLRDGRPPSPGLGREAARRLTRSRPRDPRNRRLGRNPAASLGRPLGRRVDGRRRFPDLGRRWRRRAPVAASERSGSPRNRGRFDRTGGHAPGTEGRRGAPAGSRPSPGSSRLVDRLFGRARAPHRPPAFPVSPRRRVELGRRILAPEGPREPRRRRGRLKVRRSRGGWPDRPAAPDAPGRRSDRDDALGRPHVPRARTAAVPPEARRRTMHGLRPSALRDYRLSPLLGLRTRGLRHVLLALRRRTPAAPVSDLRVDRARGLTSGGGSDSSSPSPSSWAFAPAERPRVARPR
jgi:hypothetical protein